MSFIPVGEALSRGQRLALFAPWLDVRSDGLSFLNFMDHAPDYGAVVFDGVNERLAVSDDALCYLYERFDGRAWKLAPFQHASAEIYKALAFAPVDPWDFAPEFFGDVSQFLAGLGLDFEANRDVRPDVIGAALRHLGGPSVDFGVDIQRAWCDGRGRYLCAALSPWLNGTEIARLVCAKWPSGDRSLLAPLQTRDAAGCRDAGEFEPRFLPVKGKDCTILEVSGGTARRGPSLGAWRDRPRNGWWEFDAAKGAWDDDAF